MYTTKVNKKDHLY